MEKNDWILFKNDENKETFGVFKWNEKLENKKNFETLFLILNYLNSNTQKLYNNRKKDFQQDQKEN